MSRRKKPTTDAVEIFDQLFVKGDPEMIAMIDQERVNSEIAQIIYDIRTEAGLSQRDLAKLVGTTASVICRLEDSDYQGHSLNILQRIASALNKRIEIRCVDAKR